MFRRYAEFYAFHQKYRKLHPVFNTYGFPPRKTIGRRVLNRFVKFSLIVFIGTVYEYIGMIAVQSYMCISSLHRDSNALVCFWFQETKFVEERRRKLQDYLRRVVNFMLAKYPEFAQNTTPSSAMSRIPLLAESSLAESGASSINAGTSISGSASATAAGAGAASNISGRERERERTRGERSRASAILNTPPASALRDNTRTSMGTLNEAAGSGSTSRASHQRPSLPSNVVPNRKKMSNQPSYSGL